MTEISNCPNCGIGHIAPFYGCADVPVHSVVMVKSREEALHYPLGDIELGLCNTCGFIFNSAFNADLQDYAHDYESTQAHSQTFNRFHVELADTLIQHFGLKNRDIIEIGCGQGEFLTLLCDRGQNRGIGFDPAFEPDRQVGLPQANVTFVKDYYSKRYSKLKADLVCCKMTLEHIPQTRHFMATIHDGMRDSCNAVVFVQVPSARRILEQRAFWDIYYEHCSYFDVSSLTYLFRSIGFDVSACWTDYDDQYLMISGSAAQSKPSDLPKPAGLSTEYQDLVTAFSRDVGHAIERWKEQFGRWRTANLRSVLWGGSSKAVAFLTSIMPGVGVDCVVDINPLKRNTFLPGTGHQVVLPNDLVARPPDQVIAMNPIYCSEISERLAALGLSPRIIPLTGTPTVM